MHSITILQLLNTERLTIFAADLQVCFLLFESQRSCLKFHLEYYLNKLTEIIGSENQRMQYEIRELALDNLLQFLRIPSFATELYVNYDCNLYCTNLLEDLVKLLSKNSLSATQIYSIHDISLDGLMTIIDDIEKNCSKQVVAKDASVTVGFVGGRHSRNSSSIDKIILDHSGSDLHATTSGGEDSGTVQSLQSFINKKKHSSVNADATGETTVGPDAQNKFDAITHDQLMEIKNRKQILTQGTELFNQRPDKGIQFLQEHNYLNPQLDPAEVAHFLRENSSLDKNMIGEYISKKKNVESKILENFVKSFNFESTRIDLALRQYLETFRLPGEAPLIMMVMEHFADHWHVSCIQFPFYKFTYFSSGIFPDFFLEFYFSFFLPSKCSFVDFFLFSLQKMNGEPFADTDAAFRLAYAIIMLNMDQHNSTAKRLNIPMTAEDFKKNLRGCNGKRDFDDEMLESIFNAIK